MCGIVGLYLKDAAMEPAMGRLLAGMLATMSQRGPDSAGFAVYAATTPGWVKLVYRRQGDIVFPALREALAASLGDAFHLDEIANHVVLCLPEGAATEAQALIDDDFPGLLLASTGHKMELFKDVGLPAAVAERFGLASRSGSHGIGHTRMATESAVTIAGAHPFSTGRDQCLVHNGSLSNHNQVRRRLSRNGVRFATENDSEVAAGFLTWRLAQGDGLGTALEACLSELDGFFTFVVGTENGFGVLRDPVSCKPAVMAETDQYVAFGSEFRALAGLPGIENAKVFEPAPAKVYFWERAQ